MLAREAHETNKLKNMEPIYLSKERYDELVRELEELKTKGRAEVAKRLKEAKEAGDLSESSEYEEAREAQSRLEARISELDALLKNISIIKKTAGVSEIGIGSRVIVKKNGEIFSYTIVGSSEADPGKGFISNESPLGKGLLGKKPGDSVKIETPKGNVVYEIISIN